MPRAVGVAIHLSIDAMARSGHAPDHAGSSDRERTDPDTSGTTETAVTFRFRGDFAPVGKFLSVL
jgi:hypothetical protein